MHIDMAKIHYRPVNHVKQVTVTVDMHCNNNNNLVNVRCT